MNPSSRNKGTIHYTISRVLSHAYMNHIIFNTRLFRNERFFHARKRVINYIDTLFHHYSPWAVSNKALHIRSSGKQSCDSGRGSARRRVALCPTQTVNRRLDYIHVLFNLTYRSFESCKGFFRHPLPVQMSCEYWHDRMVVLESHLKKLGHLPVGLE
jgi:hypothetical protein